MTDLPLASSPTLVHFPASELPLLDSHGGLLSAMAIERHFMADCVSPAVRQTAAVRSWPPPPCVGGQPSA